MSAKAARTGFAWKLSPCPAHLQAPASGSKNTLCKPDALGDRAMTGSAPHDASLAVHGAVAAEVEGRQVVVRAARRQAGHALAERGDGRHRWHVHGRRLQIKAHRYYNAPLILQLSDTLSSLQERRSPAAATMPNPLEGECEDQQDSVSLPSGSPDGDAKRVQTHRFVGGPQAIELGSLGRFVKQGQVLRAGVAGGCLNHIHGGDHTCIPMGTIEAAEPRPSPAQTSTLRHLAKAAVA